MGIKSRVETGCSLSLSASASAPRVIPSAVPSSSLQVAMSDEPSRYGVAALDQLDDDEPSAAAPAASVAAASSNDADAAALGDESKQAEVETFALAVGVIEPPPELKGEATEQRAQPALLSVARCG